MNLGSTTGYSECVITEHLEGPAIQGGVQLGGSYCDDTTCSPYRPLRAYYLTQQAVQGNQTLSQCASGFHMASIHEIRDPTLLRYDSSLGLTFADSGEGPPTGNSIGAPIEAYGWVRTGAPAETSSTSGSGAAPNCNVWTSNTGSHLGTVIALYGKGRDTTPTNVELPLAPWDGSVLSCLQLRPVWCVQD